MGSQFPGSEKEPLIVQVTMCALLLDPYVDKSRVHTVLGFRVPYSDATHSVSEQTGQRMPKFMFSYSSSYPVDWKATNENEAGC